MAFCLAAPSAPALDPFHEIVTASEQCFVLGIECSLTLAAGVQPADLLHSPAQAALQSCDDHFQIVGKRFNMVGEHRWGGNIGVRLRPALLEYPALSNR